MLSLRLLGTPQILVDGSTLRSLSSAKSQALLFYLAMHGRHPQSRLTIAGLLWPNKTDKEARVNLRQAIRRLRKALPAYIEATRSTVALTQTETIEIDAQQFQIGIRAGLDGDVDALQTAVNLYHDDFLSGFFLDGAAPFEEWMLAERERLRLAAIQGLHQLALNYSEQQSTKPGLAAVRRLLEIEPWREEAHRQLMVLLVADGQISAALAQFEQCRHILAVELDVAPGAETTALYEAIKAENAIVRHTAASPPPTIPHNLPPPSTTFIGRSRELAGLDNFVTTTQSRLLTIIGPGGIGKTRFMLAYANQFLTDPQQIGQHFFDGIYFVSLANLNLSSELSLADQISLAIIRALKLSLETRDGRHTRSAKQQLLDYLRPKKLVLLLDNFEDLPGGYVLVADILRSAPDVQLIVTSRERLNLYEERIFNLPGLALPTLDEGDTAVQSEAVQLFIRAARRAYHDFTLAEEDQASLIKLCHFLGGSPLAIELAASWVDTLSLANILAELRHDLNLLDTNLHNVADRHRSMSQILEYAWQRLSLEEQTILAALSICRGGFTRPAAHIIAANNQSIPPRQLASLLHKSLLTYDRERDRYEMHELLRQFAVQKCAEVADWHTAVCTRHAAVYCRLLQDSNVHILSDRQQTTLALLEADIKNIRLAWRWSIAQCKTTNLAIALDGLFHFFDTRSWFQEGERALREAASCFVDVGENGEETAVIQAKIRARQGWFLFHLGQQQESIWLLNESMQFFRQHGITSQLIFTLNYLGAVMHHQGRYDEAYIYLTEARQLAQSNGDQYQASLSLNILGQLMFAVGEYTAAYQYCQEALYLKRKIGDRRGMTYSLTNLGQVAEAQADYEEAGRLLQESMSISEAIGDQRGVAFGLQNLGNVALVRGQMNAAETHYTDSLAISRKIGNRLGMSLNLIRLGETAIIQNNPIAAQDFLQEGMQIALTLESIPTLVEGVLGTAVMWQAAGQIAQSHTCAQFAHRFPDSSPAQKERAEGLLVEGETAVFPFTDDIITFVTNWVLTQLAQPPTQI
ncbi:MAG: tetratricopeptide repeat protein [Chloroflexi bacterium]|nr:tetratricopeptide repeat protein [Chloroflexota bacterium]